MKHPAYIHAKRQLKNGKFVSIRQCHADFEDIWRHYQHEKNQIRQALEDYRNDR